MRVLLKYLSNVAVAFDQLLNALLGGDPDETISSRLGKFQHRVGLYHWICLALDLIDPGHCRDAIELDEGKDQITPFGARLSRLPRRLLAARWEREDREC